jgi:uncharacterized protein (DUF488 family)
METFIELLVQHEIEVLADIRSHPFSKYAKHFDHDNLQKAIRANGLKYVYLGRELGGMPKDRALYDADGHVVYSRIAETESFKEGIERLLKGIESYKIALMCAEENPTNCHRRRLVASYLIEKGYEVLHIRRGGKLNTDEDLEENTEEIAAQLNLFSHTDGS